MISIIYLSYFVCFTFGLELEFTGGLTASETEIIINDLINKGYIEALVDPDTKNYYSESSTIKLENDHFVFTPFY